MTTEQSGAVGNNPRDQDGEQKSHQSAETLIRWHQRALTSKQLPAADPPARVVCWSYIIPRLRASVSLFPRVASSAVILIVVSRSLVRAAARLSESLLASFTMGFFNVAGSVTSVAIALALVPGTHGGLCSPISIPTPSTPLSWHQ